jgi:hypothetical protein
VSQRLLTPRERIAARLLTGSLAHLYAGVLDWLTLAARYARARAAGRKLD